MRLKDACLTVAAMGTLMLLPSKPAQAADLAAKAGISSREAQTVLDSLAKTGTYMASGSQPVTA